jgi:quercetin dioxygenase-like cupin family protein
MFIREFGSRDFTGKREGVRIKSITGRNAQLAWVVLDPGQATDHVHDQEQIGYVLSGQLRVTIGTSTEDLSGGDAYCIPAQVRHGFRVLGDTKAEYFEVFSPPKEENTFPPG